MKRLIIAAALFVAVAASYATSLWYIKDACDGANRLLRECEQAYADGGDAYEKAHELKEEWSKKENMLSLFVTHNSIDEIELVIAELCVYSKAKEENDFYERTQTLKTLLHQVNEDTGFTPHSIF